MGHFFHSAAAANILGTETSYSGGIKMEKIQEFLKSIPGLEGFSESAWTPEDLTSDLEGARLGTEVGLTGVPSLHWLHFLANAGVAAHKKDAKIFLIDDVRSWAGERFKSRGNALQWQFERLAHKCLCDGVNPKPDYCE